MSHSETTIKYCLGMSLLQCFPLPHLCHAHPVPRPPPQVGSVLGWEELLACTGFHFISQVKKDVPPAIVFPEHDDSGIQRKAQKQIEALLGQSARPGTVLTPSPLSPSPLPSSSHQPLPSSPLTLSIPHLSLLHPVNLSPPHPSTPQSLTPPLLSSSPLSHPHSSPSSPLHLLTSSPPYPLTPSTPHPHQFLFSSSLSHPHPITPPLLTPSPPHPLPSSLLPSSPPPLLTPSPPHSSHPHPLPSSLPSLLTPSPPHLLTSPLLTPIPLHSLPSSPHHLLTPSPPPSPGLPQSSLKALGALSKKPLVARPLLAVVSPLPGYHSSNKPLPLTSHPIVILSLARLVTLAPLPPPPPPLIRLPPCSLTQLRSAKTAVDSPEKTEGGKVKVQVGREAWESTGCKEFLQPLHFEVAEQFNYSSSPLLALAAPLPLLESKMLHFAVTAIVAVFGEGGREGEGEGRRRRRKEGGGGGGGGWMGLSISLCFSGPEKLMEPQAKKATIETSEL